MKIVKHPMFVGGCFSLIIEILPLQEQLSRRMEELQAERSKTEAHIQSLKKRKADLSVCMEPYNSYYTHHQHGALAVA